MALKRIGVLWKKQDKDGKDYYSGSMDLGVMGDAKVMVFQNERKEETNHPDMLVHLLTDTPETRQSRPTGQEKE